MLTLVFSAVGLVIAVLLRRLAARPRVAWIRVTVALTMVSFVPDVLADAAVATRLPTGGPRTARRARGRRGGPR